MNRQSWAAEIPFWLLCFVWKGLLPVCVQSLPGTAWWCIWSTASGPQECPSLLEVWVTAWKQCGQGQSLPLVRLESDSQTVLWEWSILGWPCFPWEMRLNWGTTSWPVLCPDISWERCQGLHLGICFCLKVWDFFVDFWGFWLCLFY